VITGCWTSAWNGSHRYGRWSPEGLDHFNKLVKIVQQDQASDMHFQAQYEIWLSECLSTKKEKAHKSNALVVQAY